MSRWLSSTHRVDPRFLAALVLVAFLVSLVESARAQGGGAQLPPRVAAKAGAGERDHSDPGTHPNPPGG